MPISANKTKCLGTKKNLSKSKNHLENWKIALETEA